MNKVLFIQIIQLIYIAIGQQQRILITRKTDLMASSLKHIDTSKVFMQVNSQNQFTYFLPGYLRLNVKNFTNVNLENLEAQMNTAIIFSVYYGALPEHLIEGIEKNIKLSFERDTTLQLSESQNLDTEVKRVKQTSTLHFYVKKIFHLRIQSDVFWSPFEIIHTIFSITVQSVVIGDTVIEINLMDHPHKIEKLFTSELDTFGNYSLALAYTEAQYSNVGVRRAKDFMSFTTKSNTSSNQQNSQDQQMDECGEFLIAQNMGCFRHAHFNIPLYKMPMSSLTTIFFPLWLLGIINLGIFFQDNSLGQRIASIAALMIAFAALIPTIRNQIPPHPGWVFVQVLVYLQTATSLLALFHSVSIRDDQGFKLIWFESGFFIVALAVTLLTIVYVVFMIGLHYMLWEPMYLKIHHFDKKSEIPSKQSSQKTVQAVDSAASLNTPAGNKQKQKRSFFSRKVITSKKKPSLRRNISNASISRNNTIRFVRSEWKNYECNHCFDQIQKIQKQNTFIELEDPQNTNGKSDSSSENNKKNNKTEHKFPFFIGNQSMMVEFDDKDDLARYSRNRGGN